MDKGSSSTPMEINILAHLKRARNMVLAFSFGKIIVSMKVNSEMGCPMDKVELSKTIRSFSMENSLMG